jgi:N-acyl-D-amino-acid deacylase
MDERLDRRSREVFDLIIRRTRLIDGSGAPSRVSDVGVVGDRIGALEELGHARGATEVDGRGLALAPGFIDTHTHDDRALLSNPLMPFKISQGVTTVITGNCGLSLGPITLRESIPPSLSFFAGEPTDFVPEFGRFLRRLDEEPPAVNAACLVGHTTLRVAALTSLDRPATVGEIRDMRRGLDRALADGALGLSTCLDEPETTAAPTEEVMELAAPLAAADGMYCTHIRDQGAAILEALEEALAIGRAAAVPVVLSHHKCAGQENQGRTRQTLALIDEARARQPVGLDAYPYTASSTYLDPVRVKRASRTIIAWSQAIPEAAGRDLVDVAAEMGLSLEATCLRLRPAGGIYFMMAEEDVQRVLGYPATMIGSDGSPHDAHPHPRLWGTFPRVLGHYARDLGLFTVEEAVRRMTSLPAACFGLVDRGVLRVGAFADLVLFDPETVVDRATFDKPTTPSAGIELVVVNGRIVWQGGGPTGARPGRRLARGRSTVAHEHLQDGGRRRASR